MKDNIFGLLLQFNKKVIILNSEFSHYYLGKEVLV